MKSNLFLFLLVIFALGLSGCPGPVEPKATPPEPVKNTTKAITAFSFANPAATGVIDEIDHSITVRVPYGTDPSDLMPTIAHNGVGISPLSGQAQDFATEKTYTVTAEDGSIQAYLINVVIAASNEKAITGFSFANLAVTGIVSEVSHTISLTVPYGTNLTNLIPTITHTGAGISPASGQARDFSGSVTYSVSAADGSTQAYSVNVTVSLNSAKAISAFSIGGIPAIIDETNHRIFLALNSGTYLNGLAAVFTTTGNSVKVGAVTQTSGITPNNFTNQLNYTVIAADGSTQTYQVACLIPPTLLGVTKCSSTRIDLEWTDVSSQETGYSVERRLVSGGAYSVVATLTANTSAYSDIGLQVNTGYIYRVRAIHGWGQSQYTGELTKYTYPNPPSAPSNLSTTSVSFVMDYLSRPSFKCSFTWQDNSSDESNFQLFGKTSAGVNYTVLGNTDIPNLTSLSTTNVRNEPSNSNLLENTTYYFYVVAYNNGGYSANSNVLPVTTSLYAPRHIENGGYVIANKNPILDWYCDTTIADGFQIQRSNDGITYTAIGITTDPGLYGSYEYTDTTAARTTHYFWRVRAYKGGSLVSDWAYADFVTE